MKLKLVIHEAEEGGFWAEVPSIPGCVTQGNTFGELLIDIYDAVEACLSINVLDIAISEKDKVGDRDLKVVSGKRFCRLLESLGWTGSEVLDCRVHNGTQSLYLPLF